MSPTHSNKCGVRYRYYVSHAILQNRRVEADSIARVPAPKIETLVRDGVRRHLGSMGEAEPPTATADRDLIELHVARVIVNPQALEVCLIPTCEASAQSEEPLSLLSHFAGCGRKTDVTRSKQFRGDIAP
jgi:site-specific DNA recombinase